VVVELIDLDTVHVTVDVAERYIGLVKVGQEARVRVDAYPEERFQGRVFAIVPQAQHQARSFPVKIAVQNPEYVLRSGMFARADFAIGEPYMALLVPKDALVSQGGNYVVYIVRDGVANPVPVKLGDAFESLVSVEAEISAGAPVIVRGNERLFPSQPVEVLPPAP
jgi:RND family efflux transporter MFP subunit